MISLDPHNHAITCYWVGLSIPPIDIPIRPTCDHRANISGIGWIRQEVIRLMGTHQLGIELGDEQVVRIERFLGTLTGTVDPEYITEPELPESGPDTPAPDPS